MKSVFAILFGLLCGSVGYSAGADESWIYDRLLKSPRFLAAKSLCEKGHVPLICMIEAIATESADVYIGEDMGDHANRIATARVFRNGTVKYLAYDANGEDQWIAEDPHQPENRTMKTEPNKAMEPTPVNVTIPAGAGLAPFTSAAHLGR